MLRTSPSQDGVCRLAQRQEQWCWRAIAAGLPDRLPQRLRARPSPTPVRRSLLAEPRAQCEGRPRHGCRRRRRARRIRERGRTALDGGGAGGANGDARQAALRAGTVLWLAVSVRRPPHQTRLRRGRPARSPTRRRCELGRSRLYPAAAPCGAHGWPAARHT